MSAQSAALGWDTKEGVDVSAPQVLTNTAFLNRMGFLNSVSLPFSAVARDRP